MGRSVVSAQKVLHIGKLYMTPCQTSALCPSLSISVEQWCIKLNEAETVKGLPGIIWSA